MADVVKTTRIKIVGQNDTAAAFRGVLNGLNGLDREARRVAKGFQGIGRGFTIAGVIAGFALLTKRTADITARTSDLSQQLNISTETLSGIAYAGKQVGLSFEESTGAIETFNRALADAKAGGESAQGFQALGFDFDKFKEGEGAFFAFADRMAALRNDANKTAGVAKVLGEDLGPRLAPLLNQGSGAIKAQAAEIRDLGGAVTEGLGDAGREFRRQIARLEGSATAIQFQVAGPLVKAVADIAAGLTEATKNISAGGNVWEGFANVLKYVAIGFITIGSAAAAAARDIGAVLAAKDQFFKGNFSTAFEILRQRGLDQVREQESLTKSINRILNPPEIPKADLKGGNELAKKLVDLQKLAKVTANARIKELEREVKEEGEILSARLANLSFYYGQGYLTVKQNFDRQRAAIEEATSAQVKAINQQIKLAKEYAATKGLKPEEREAAIAKVTDLEQNRTDAIRAGAAATLKTFQEQTVEQGKYSDTIQKLRADLAELRGETGEAYKIRFEIDNRVLLAQIEAGKDAAAKSVVDQVKAEGIAAAEIEKRQKRASLLTDFLSLQEDRLTNARRAGAISELGYMKELSLARQKAIPEYSRIADEIDAIAKSSKNPEFKLLAERFKVEVEKMRADADLLGEKINTIFVDSFANALDDVVLHTKSVSEAFKDMADAILKDITRLATQSIAQDLFGTLFKVDPKTGKGGITQFFESIGSALASAKGNAFAAGGRLAKFAFGGIVDRPTGFRYAAAGGAAFGVMGEAGPEAILPLSRDRRGRLGVSAGGGGYQVTNNFTIAGPVDTRTQSQIAASVSDGLARAMRRQR